MHKRDGESREIADIIVQEFGGVVHLVVEAAVADLLYVGVIGSGDKLLEVGEAARSRVRVDQLRLDVRLAGLLACHLLPHICYLITVCTVHYILKHQIVLIEQSSY